jgi:hypothetical protein
MASGFLKAQSQTEMSASSRPGRRLSGITWRSILISLLIIPLNAYWVVQMEIIRYTAHPTTISLFFNVIFILLLLTGANALYARLRPGWQLTQPELLAIYTMVCIASAICGHDFLEVLVPAIAWPFMYASVENNWAELFNLRIPTWLSVQDKAVMQDYFYGNSTLYTWPHLLGWATPVLMWTLFIGLLLIVMFSINTIVRQQWDKREALTYPLTLLPLEITHPAGRLFRQRLLWIGFGVAAFIDIVNSFAYYRPDMYHIPIDQFNLATYTLPWPWNALGWVPTTFYPFVIGLGMLMPVDFLFSCWFFYFFWKAEVVASTALGFNIGLPNFPYLNQQAFGAYMLFPILAVWQARRHLVAVARRALGLPGGADDTDEPTSYRTAVVGLLVGFAGLIFFTHAMGMSVWLAVLFFLIYFALSLSVIRMRAEFGSPIHDLHQMGPDYTLSALAGTANLGKENLIVMAQFYWFNRAYRSHPMPFQLEGDRMMEKVGALDRRYFPAMLAMGIFGALAGFWAILHLNYSYGATAKAALSFGWEAFDQLAIRMNFPQGLQYEQIIAIIVGFVAAFLMAKARYAITGWPFHPLGFAISSNYGINMVWMPLLVAWLIKIIMLRYSGLQGFRKALPFFYGMILGQFVVGSLLNLITMALGIQSSYMFWD